MNKLSKDLKVFELKSKLNELNYVKKLYEYGFDICNFRYPLIFKVNKHKLNKSTVENKFNFSYNIVSNYEYIWFVDRNHYLEFLLNISCVKNKAGESDLIKKHIKDFSCLFSEYLVASETELSVDLFKLGKGIMQHNEDLKSYDLLVSEIVRLNKELEALENENIKSTKTVNRD